MKRSVKILLLEDNPSDVELLKYELKHSGMSFDIKVVDSREAYLNALKDFRPEVILSDHSLPSFNSIEALALARQKSMVPFILVTGTVSEEFAVSCMKAGATDYILKASLKRLPSAIENALTAI
jgi:CheY-like chemotaxis protein